MPPEKMGRPKSDTPKDGTLRIRVDKELLEIIDECAETLNTTRSDIVRKGVRKIYDGLKK